MLVLGKKPSQPMPPTALQARGLRIQDGERCATSYENAYGGSPVRQKKVRKSPRFEAGALPILPGAVSEAHRAIGAEERKKRRAKSRTR